MIMYINKLSTQSNEIHANHGKSFVPVYYILFQGWVNAHQVRTHQDMRDIK
jgi:hypothetical protein